MLTSELHDIKIIMKTKPTDAPRGSIAQQFITYDKDLITLRSFTKEKRTKNDHLSTSIPLVTPKATRRGTTNRDLAKYTRVHYFSPTNVPDVCQHRSCARSFRGEKSDCNIDVTNF